MAGILAVSTPADGTMFGLSPVFPKHASCDLEFRDGSGVLWPSFYYGRPLEDGFWLHHTQSPKADFALRCDTLVQAQGDQTRRVFGELITDGKADPAVFRVRSVRPADTPTVGVEGRAVPDGRSIAGVPVDAVLAVNGRMVELTDAYARVTYRWEKSGEPASALIDIFFTAEGRQLGLKAVDLTITGRAGVTAYRGGPKKN